MIVRWYMALSEFTFNIEFISGEDNGICQYSVFSTLGMSNMSRTPPQVRIDESNRSLDQIRDYGDDNDASSPIERLDRDSQGGLQIYSTTINVDIDDDAEDESQVDERLDIKTIGRILLRIESSISSMGNRLTAVERSQLDDTIQFQMPQRFGESTPIPASGL